LKILFYGGSSGLLFPREGDFFKQKVVCTSNSSNSKQAKSEGNSL